MSEVSDGPSPDQHSPVRLSHDRIWAAIDGLAQRHGLSPSGLARRAGLDATSFNRSKRIGSDGRRRWPSTESVAKILDATGTDLDAFLQLSLAGGGGRSAVPLVTSTQAGVLTPSGLPDGVGEEMVFPDLDAGRCFAIEVQGDALAPAYRDGDLVVVSATVSPRKGDRVVARLAEGGWAAGELVRRTARVTDLAGGAARTVPNEAIVWIARVMWVRL
ncbi:MAG: helix-turn-helix transcriptional regulator [Methylobacterium frigidaeris]